MNIGTRLKLGLVFDLRGSEVGENLSCDLEAEFDFPSTIDALVSAIEKSGFLVHRIQGVRDLLKEVEQEHDIDLFFSIAEGRWGFGREALVPAILDEFQVPYVLSGPLALATTLHKPTAKALVEHAGIPTSQWIEFSKVSDVCEPPFGFPCFVKPVAEGSSKGIDGTSCVNDVGGLLERVSSIVERYCQPALVEQYLPGKEYTIAIIGNQNDEFRFASAEVVPLSGNDYDFDSKERCETEVNYVSAVDCGLERQLQSFAVQAMCALNIVDACRFDFRLNDLGVPCFLEANPLPGLHPTHSDLPIAFAKRGVSYEEVVGAILTSAIRRIGRF